MGCTIGTFVPLVKSFCEGRMNFGDRLREERNRLSLSQTELGRIGGVQARAQRYYESGERHPDSNYLSAIAAAGVDVLYILTGRKEKP